MCAKCQKKGIECSGLGRIRFSTGVARRGRLKGCAVPAVDGLTASTFETRFESSTASPRQIRWKNDPPGRRKRKAAKRTSAVITEQDESCQPAPDNQTKIVTSTISNGRRKDTVEVDEYVYPGSEKSLCKTSSGPLTPWIDPMDSQTRMLMSHCKQSCHPYQALTR